MVQGYRPPKLGWDRIVGRFTIDRKTGCWLFLGSVNSTGYGTMGIGSRIDGSRRTILVHRYVYELFYGPLGALDALHSCDNPPCINPMHLFSGDQQANVDDMWAKGRQVVLRGERVGTSKLTVVEVRKIKRLCGKLSDGAIGRRFGVSTSTVEFIRKGRHWGHVC